MKGEYVVSILLKRNDIKDIITYTVEDINGVAFDLTGASVRFIIGKKNKVITSGVATIDNAILGQVSYTITDSDTLVAGVFPAEFEVTFPDGKFKTFPTVGNLQVNIQPNLDLGRTSVAEEIIALRVSEIQLFKDEVDAKIRLIEALNVDVTSLFANYDFGNYLMSAGGFKFQMGVEDDGTLYVEDYDGTYPSAFNPISADGSKWRLTVENNGALNTIKVVG
jgi:hypothetical protein